MRQITKLSSKNQTTVPASVRGALGLRPGDRLVFEVAIDEPTPVVTLHRYPTLDDVAGSVPVPSDVRGLAWSEIRARAWAPEAPRKVRRARA
jgi:AbrB family looped-hinge helix DNA binding protein